MKVDSTLIHRLFYPQVPAVLSAQFRGRTSAMPVVAYASISDSPPLVAISCRPGSFTLKLALQSGAFSICILDRKHLGSVESLGTRSGEKSKDKILAAGLSHERGLRLPVPAIKGAEATLECSLHSETRLGDHVLLVGEVKAAYASRAFKKYWDFHRYRPILYAGLGDGMVTYTDADQ